jgi:hypothetical protein
MNAVGNVAAREVHRPCSWARENARPEGDFGLYLEALLPADDSGMADVSIDHESAEWVRARKRVTERRDFGSHVVVYAVVNGVFIVIWALTGGGYFWPAWMLGLWGIGLVLHAWEAFVRRPVTDEDVEAELRRQRR